jgi:hypothetical protein
MALGTILRICAKPLAGSCIFLGALVPYLHELA